VNRIYGHRCQILIGFTCFDNSVSFR
jgi:hypothetical protein